MRITNAQDYDEPRDSISHDWSKRLVSWGKTPMPVPNIGQQAVPYLEAISPAMLILSGGEDIGISPSRDQTEFALLEYALATGLPVLGVCRGLQLINTYFGGTLGLVEDHVGHPHPVTINNTWTPFYGPTARVNSFHNVCIPRQNLAPDLLATAVDSEGNVEAAEHRMYPLGGVMWHPERLDAPEGDRALLESLCSRRVSS